MAQYAVEILYRDEVTGYVMFIRKTVEVPTEGLAVHVEWLPTNKPILHARFHWINPGPEGWVGKEVTP